MSYKKGGIFGLKQAIKAKTLCTVEFDNLIQVSGIVSDYFSNKNEISYIKFVNFRPLRHWTLNFLLLSGLLITNRRLK